MDLYSIENSLYFVLRHNKFYQNYICKEDKLYITPNINEDNLLNASFRPDLWTYIIFPSLEKQF